ncbi:MAG: GNAT family N-acetyltransferase [Woeseia sp.]
MTDVHELQARDYADVSDTTGFDRALLTAESADQHLVAVGPKLDVRARCSVWWRDTASLDGQRIGAIGHYAANDHGSGRSVILRALAELRSKGCDIAVGPMNGNTWRSYRFIVDRGTAKPFFLEPDNDDSWPGHFTECGFEPLSRYVSELNFDIANRQPEVGSLRRKMDRLGIRITPLNTGDPDDELDGIYDVVCEGFRDSLLYTPLDRDSYRSMYEPLLYKVDPRLILVAKHDDRVVGFIFSPPDYMQAESGRQMDTIVIKTIAILPRRRYSGLGRLLILDLLRNALDQDYTSAISALMHVDNRSQKISSGCAGPMRTYALFARSVSS